MKKLITAVLVAIFVVVSRTPAKANTTNTTGIAPRPITLGEAALCITIGAFVVGAGINIAINSCKPSWRCVTDPENTSTNWCTQMTRSAIRASELWCAPMNWKTEKKCKSTCNSTNTSRFPDVEPSWIVQCIKLGSSTNEWFNAGRMESTYEGEKIFWEETIPWEEVGPGRLYRVKEVYEDETPVVFGERKKNK